MDSGRDTAGHLTTEVRFLVECRPSRDAPRGPRHAVTIHPDGTVTTPHDLEVERIAAAFGAHSSCLALVDRAVPAGLDALPLLARRRRPALRTDARGAVRVSTKDLAACCRRPFSSIATACGHLRSPEHLAARTGAALWQVRTVVTALSSAVHADLDDPVDAALVRGAGGVATLWAAGIHPDDLAELAAPARAAHAALPPSYFLAVAYGGADATWLRAAVSARPDPDAAAWLAALPSALQSDADHAATWLRLGLSRADVTTALETGIDPAPVERIARAAGIASAEAARTLVGWARIGCALTPALAGLLARTGAGLHTPSAGALDALQNVADREHLGLDRTRLAAMLVVHGTRDAALAAIRAETAPAGVDHGSRA